MTDLLTRAEAMALLRKGRSWLLAHQHEIGVVRIGRTVQFRRADLDAYIAKHLRAAPVTRVLAPATPRGRIAALYPHGTINTLTGRPVGIRAAQ